MDQTINEMVYRGRIKNTVRSWNEQTGKNVGGGTIIGSDGTSFKMVDGRLVQVLDPKLLKRVKRLEDKLTADGLLSSKNVAEVSVTAESSELVAEL